MKAFIYVVVVVAGVSATWRGARANDVPQPLVSPDDRGTDGLLARYSFRASAGATQVTTPGASAGVYSFQAFAGPVHDTAMAAMSLRIRLDTASGSDTDFRAGPLTAAVQRYFPLEPFFAAPLLVLHFGVEGAVATPWLSGQRAAPPAALATMGVDTELAGNGWGFRPSGWMRLDILACRSFYVEVGGGPELFVPTEGPNLVALRYRAALGFDVGCDRRSVNQLWRPGFIFEYRARSVVHQGALDPSYDDLWSGTLQVVGGRVTVGLTAGLEGSTDRHILGIRIQSGVWSNR